MECLLCSKVLKGESFMDLIAASAKEEGEQHVHGSENITLENEEVIATAILKTKLTAA
jgi:hypothetical protein